MSELSPETQALLDAARDLDDPTHDDRARVRKRVLAQLGAAAAGAAAGSAAASASASAGVHATAASAGTAGVGATVSGAAALGSTVAATSTKLWLALGATAALAVGSGSWVATRTLTPQGRGAVETAASSGTEQTTRTHAARAASAAVIDEVNKAPHVAVDVPPADLDAPMKPGGATAIHAAPAHANARAVPLAGLDENRPAERPHGETGADTDTPARTTARSMRATKPASRHQPGAAPLAPALETTTAPEAQVDDAPQQAQTDAQPPSQLTEELQLLRDAQRALGRRDFAQARRLADEHARRFPDGALTPERLAVQALARCQDGLDGGDAARTLLSELPDSPFAQRVRRACRPE